MSTSKLNICQESVMFRHVKFGF